MNAASKQVRATAIIAVALVALLGWSWSQYRFAADNLNLALEAANRTTKACNRLLTLKALERDIACVFPGDSRPEQLISGILRKSSLQDSQFTIQSSKPRDVEAARLKEVDLEVSGFRELGLDQVVRLVHSLISSDGRFILRRISIHADQRPQKVKTGEMPRQLWDASFEASALIEAASRNLPSPSR